MQNDFQKLELFTKDELFSTIEIVFSSFFNELKKEFSSIENEYKSTKTPAVTKKINKVKEYIKEASLLLHETDDTVSGIAYTTGFNTLHYFNEVFKRSMGMTPGKFREREK